MHAFNDGAVSENIHNPHRRDLGISWGWGGEGVVVCETKFKEMYEA